MAHIPKRESWRVGFVGCPSNGSDSHDNEAVPPEDRGPGGMGEARARDRGEGCKIQDAHTNVGMSGGGEGWGECVCEGGGRKGGRAGRGREGGSSGEVTLLLLKPEILNRWEYSWHLPVLVCVSFSLSLPPSLSLPLPPSLSLPPSAWLENSGFRIECVEFRCIGSERLTQ
jgi:hypothetical protein